jgi:PRC-barrel domain
MRSGKREHSCLRRRLACPRFSYTSVEDEQAVFKGTTVLRNANDLRGFKLGARDGELGKVKDFYFDDESWIVRYLIADTGKWLAGRQVLISPHAVKQVHAPPQKVVDGRQPYWDQSAAMAGKHQP